MKTTKVLAIMALATIMLTGCSKEFYLSSDLRLRDLYGNVEKVTLNFETELFDENGLNVTPRMVIDRDEQNRIIKFECDPQYDAGDAWFSEEFEYDADGNVSVYNKNTYFNFSGGHCYYDKDGHLTKMIAEGCWEDGGEWSAVTEFSIIESDEHGNWTKRKWHKVVESAEGTDESNGEDVREIVYRK